MEPSIVGRLFAERYQIEAALGQGGMGAVYRARDLALGEVVALKTLTLGRDPSPVAILRFRQEAKLARRITHRNIARVFDIGEHEGAFFLTMEHVEGVTLRALLATEGPLPTDRVAKIGIELCAGLSAAHAAGIVHRDLKPSNVLVEAKTGRIVIADFGIARALEGEEGLTVGAIGTPHYMPPEQIMSGVVDARTDLYALGVVLGELLTGHKPKLGEPFAPASVEQAIAALVRRCLAFDPAARPQSAEEVAAALASIVLGTPKATEALLEPTVTAPAVVIAESSSTRALPTALKGMPARAIAVLPLRYRGPAEREDFAETLTEELVDVLSRIKTLRVFGASSTERFRKDRDARNVSRELGAFAVIDAALQVAPVDATRPKEELRLTARLLDADGIQLYSGQWIGGVEDALSLDQDLARSVAEQLRVELSILSHRGDAPLEAIELYLTARKASRGAGYAGLQSAVELLERAIALAPGFAPARSAHAIASARRSYDAAARDPGRDPAASARESVAAALEIAPDEPDSHHAAALVALQTGDYSRAGDELHRALAIAPTHAAALESLGQLEFEAGFIEDGCVHVRAATALDPSCTLGLTALARHYALEADWAACDETLAEIRRRLAGRPSPYHALNIRVAAWRGDHNRLRELLVALAPEANAGVHAYAVLCIRVFLGEVTYQAIEQQLQRFPVPANLRFRCMIDQVLTEVMLTLGETSRASEHLTRAAKDVLIDVSWLDRCPTLAPLRGTAAFESARSAASRRAEALASGLMNRR